MRLNTDESFPHKSLYVLFCLVFLLWGFSATVWGDTVPSQSFEERPVKDFWQDYQTAKANEDQAKAEEIFEKFRQAKETFSGTVFETPSYLYLEEGRKELKAGNFQVAREEFHNAIKLNPFMWPAYAGLAQIRKQQEGNLKRYFLLDLKGFREAFSGKNTYFLLGVALWLANNLLWVFIIGFTLIASFLCLKYVKPFYITVSSHYEHKGAKALMFHLFAFCILMLPLGLGVNFYLAAALYLVWFFPFFESRERKVAIFLFLIAALPPFLNHFMTRLKDARVDPLLRAHQAQFYEGNAEARIAFLEQSPGQGEHANLSQLILGRLWMAKQEYRKALDYFGGIPDTSKYSAHALVHIGNIQYVSQEYQQSIATYKKSLVRNPRMGEALYNLSVVNAKLGNHREAERYRAELNRKAPEISSRLSILNADVFDAEPNYTARFLESLTRSQSVPKAWYAQPEFYIPASAGFVFLILALIHLQFRTVGFLAKACDKCGRIFFPSDSPNSEWCSQCVNLYVKKEDLPSEAKSKKFEEVKSYNKLKRRTYRYAQLILPGAKNLLKGEALSGTVIVFVWVFLLVLCFSPMTQIPHALMHYLDGPLLISYLWIGITIIYWAIFGLRPAWQED